MNTLIHNANIEKALKLLPIGLTAVLAIVLAIMLASLFWLLATPDSSQPLPATSQTIKKTVPIAVTHYGQVVANQHIFGYEKVKKSTPPPPKKTPVTRLNLVLHGIVARQGRKSYAIIANGKQAKQGVYGVGDEPQKGVKIDKILPRKVILRHSGKLEELKLPEKISTSKSNSHLPSVSSNLRPPHLSNPSPSPNNVVSKLPEDDLGALRDALTNNPDKILEIANITESKDKDGNLIGFRLSPGKNRKLFRKLGLRPGDIVTQVNGVILDSPAKGLMVMNELTSADSISITVKRGDQEVSIEKPFN